MLKEKSFRNYIVERFENQLFESIKYYSIDNKRELDFENVDSFDYIELMDIEVKAVRAYDLPGMDVSFDVIVDGSFYVKESNNHYDDEDDKHQWFKVSCIGNLEKRLDDFRITETLCYDYRDYKPDPLSDSLVPIIYKNDLEKEATAFIEKYMPEVLKGTEPVNAWKLAERMGLTVIKHKLTPDSTRFGRIFFFDCDAEFYDNGKAEIMHVPANTIVVDPEAYYLQVVGSEETTIIHECVHYDKHRKAMLLRRLYDDSVTSISCRVVMGDKSKSRTESEWMEWQANQLTPRIQMPLIPFKAKAAELSRTYRNARNTEFISDVIEPMIIGLQTEFNVSKQATKMRLVDADYEEARSALIWLDNRYVTPHSFKRGVLEPNQTFSISAADLVIASLHSKELKSKLESGCYVFVDSHLCIDDPEFVVRDAKGRATLTDYALHHMEKCCEIFDISIRSNDGIHYYTECYLNRDQKAPIVMDIKFANANEHIKVGKDKFLKEISSVLQEMPLEFSEAVRFLRGWRNMTQEELAEDAGMDLKKLQRYEQGAARPGGIEPVIMLCIGLQLPYQISKRLLELSGYALTFSQQHMGYDIILQSCATSKSVSECNDVLKEMNCNELPVK